MSQTIKLHFGTRVNRFVIEFCKSVLDIEPTIEAFENFRKNLTQEQRRDLLKKMKIFQLQMFAIKNSIWTRFANYIVKNKINTGALLEGFNIIKNEKFTYNSDNYKMTRFRIILQEYLVEKNKL